MADVSLIGPFKRLHQDRYDNYQIGRTDPRAGVARPAGALNALTDETTEQVAPVDPKAAQQTNPYAAFFAKANALGVNGFMPINSVPLSQVTQVYPSVATTSALNPALSAQLMSLQDEENAPVDATPEGAMDALRQNYNVDAGPVSLFKQINTNGSGYIRPWELTRAVMSGGGNVEQASALMQKLDPFGNGYVTVQQMMANMPGVEPPAADPAPADGPVQTDDAIGGLLALNAAQNNAPAQDIFNNLDTDFDGTLSRDDIVNAVTAGGGSRAAADALYAQLDPTNNGTVNQSQFVNNLYPRMEAPSFLV